MLWVNPKSSTPRLHSRLLRIFQLLPLEPASPSGLVSQRPWASLACRHVLLWRFEQELQCFELSTRKEESEPDKTTKEAFLGREISMHRPSQELPLYHTCVPLIVTLFPISSKTARLVVTWLLALVLTPVSILSKFVDTLGRKTEKLVEMT